MRRVQRKGKAAYFQISAAKISLKPLQNNKIPCSSAFPDENCNFGVGICHTGLASSKPDPSRALKMMVFGPRTPAPEGTGYLFQCWSQGETSQVLGAKYPRGFQVQVVVIPLRSKSIWSMILMAEKPNFWLYFLWISNLAENNPRKENQVISRMLSMIVMIFTSFVLPVLSILGLQHAAW